MDDADRAEKTADFYRHLALNACRTLNAGESVASGECLNCGEPLTGNQRWCDADCRDDYQKREEKL